MKKFLIIGLVFLLLLAFNAFGANQKEYVPNEIIVKFKNAPDRINLNSADNIETGISAIDTLNSEHKIKSMENLFEKNLGITNKISSIKKHGVDRIFLLKTSENADVERLVREYSNDPNVEYAEPNYIVHISLLPNDPNFNNLYGLHNTGQTGGTADADIDAPEAWDVVTNSSNVTIGVIDTGIDYNHTDLAENMWINADEIPGNGIDDDANGYIDDIRGWDFVNNDNNPFDDNGHGTHVSGTIGGVGNNNKGVAGVNWNVKLMALKFLGSGGSGTIADAIEAVNYATQNGAHITSNSWGGGGFSQALKDAIQAANDAGILFVAAAGNTNNNNDANPNYPSNYDVPNVVAVAATDHNDAKAGFSSFGAETVDLGAPGVNTYSTVPNGSCLNCNPSGYKSLSGTSMATPHVSGAAGLIKARFPNLTSDGIKARLLGNVDLIASMNGITVTGGRLNAFNNLEIDNNPPLAVTNLNATNSTVGSITLMWTATGDDGSAGSAKFYDIRYSTSPINDANWGNSTQAKNNLKPKPSGSAENFTVKGLEDNTTYYLAMKVLDNVGNPSALSNVISGITKPKKVIFKDDMESGINGWSSISLWHQETNRAYSPIKSWAYNTGSPNYNYNVGNNSGNLTSPSINLSNQTSAILKFKYLYQTEEQGTSWDKRFIQIGVDGIFNNAAQLSGDEMLVWHNYSLDMSQYAGNSNVQVRFFFDTIDGILNDFEGWYIDDVIVFGDPEQVQNQPPVANASQDQNLTDADGSGAENATLNGSLSYDPDGNIAAYEWKEGTNILGTTVVLTTSVNVGLHNIQLTVTDNSGLNASDNVTVQVNPKPNEPPVANASQDQNLTDADGSGAENATLNGSLSYDPDGNIAAYEWKEDSTLLSNLVAFTYNFSVGNHNLILTVTDNDGLTGTDNVTVNVKPKEPLASENLTLRAISAYAEKNNSPSYRLVNGSILGNKQYTASIGARPQWLEIASNPNKREMVMAAIDDSSDVNAQVWNGNSWGNLKELTKSSRNNYKSIDVEYESQSGDALVVYSDVSGTASQDMIPRYNIWNGISWSAQAQASSVGAVPTAIELASNPNKDEIILVTNDDANDINAQVWNGNSWSSPAELSPNAFSAGQPFDAEYESISGDGLIVYTNGTDKRIYYRTVSNGVIGAEQIGPALGNRGRMYNLIPNPKSDEIILMVIDNDADTRVMIWNGNSWSDKGEVSTSAQSTTYMGIAGAYESNSGDAVLVYSNNQAMLKFRVWDGATLSPQQNGALGQDIPRWMKMASNPNTDELLLIANTRNNHADAHYWSGSSWTRTSLSTANSTSTRAGIAVGYENS